MKINYCFIVLIVSVIAISSCKKTDNKVCTLRILNSPNGQHQNITANIDATGYTNTNAVTLLADGGTPLKNYTWSIELSPTPPANYIFWTQSGVIYRTGNITTSNGLKVGTSSFKVKVSDGSCEATNTIDIIVTDYNIGAAAVFQQLPSNFQLKNGDANKPYGASLYAMGGIPPYKWKLDQDYAESNGLTTAGLEVEETAGIVRGTIMNSASGSIIKFKVIVTDAAGTIAVYKPVYSIIIN